MSVDPRYPAVLAERYHLPDPTLRCECNDLGTLHRLGTERGDLVRKECSRPGCGCRRFKAKEGEADMAGRGQVWRGTAWPGSAWRGDAGLGGAGRGNDSGPGCVRGHQPERSMT